MEGGTASGEGGRSRHLLSPSAENAATSLISAQTRSWHGVKERSCSLIQGTTESSLFQRNLTLNFAHSFVLRLNVRELMADFCPVSVDGIFFCRGCRCMIGGSAAPGWSRASQPLVRPGGICLCSTGS